jgi:hypothetical protein
MKNAYWDHHGRGGGVRDPHRQEHRGHHESQHQQSWTCPFKTDISNPSSSQVKGTIQLTYRKIGKP